jgi:hypothetical protein
MITLTSEKKKIKSIWNESYIKFVECCTWRWLALEEQATSRLSGDISADMFSLGDVDKSCRKANLQTQM